MRTEIRTNKGLWFVWDNFSPILNNSLRFVLLPVKHMETVLMVFPCGVLGAGRQKSAVSAGVPRSAPTASTYW